MPAQISLASYGKDAASSIGPPIAPGTSLYGIKEKIIPAITWTEYLTFLILLIFAYFFIYHEIRIRQLENLVFRK